MHRSNSNKLWLTAFLELVDQFALPEEHDVLLTLHSLFHLGSQHLPRLLLLHFENGTKCSLAELFDDLVAPI